MRPPRNVVVVGGGLAGITAAIALSDSGASVTLLEARPRLGGATTSFTRGSLVVDNGQHVFLRCCTAYRGLLARLGMTGAVSLQDRFDVTVLSAHGRGRLRRTRLPGPLHMAPALAGYRFLSPAERLRVPAAALALARLDPGRPEADAERLGDWLATRGQSERARRALWDLFTVSALNVAGDDASLALAATVVKTALLSARDAADIGVPAVPLGELHGSAAARLLRRLGARVRLGAKAQAVEALAAGGFVVRVAARPSDGAGLEGEAQDPGALPADAELAPGWALADGATGAVRPGGPSHDGRRGGAVAADAVVLAVPPHVAARLAPTATFAGAAGPGQPAGTPGALAGPGPAEWARLETSPIVNVHVVYDRRVTRLPFAAAVGSPVQWVFDRTGPAGLRTGQYLAVSLSAADAYVDVPSASLREEFLPALAELFPAAREARVTDFFVTRERRATLRQTPGCGRLRPGAATAMPGLVLAGAWTDTGWPDTMEGAVRSGLNAARQLRAAHAATPGAPEPGVIGAPA